MMPQTQSYDKVENWLQNKIRFNIVDYTKSKYIIVAALLFANGLKL